MWNHYKEKVVNYRGKTLYIQLKTNKVERIT